MIEDITARKQAEEQVRRSADRKLLATLESITDGLVSFDRQWRYTYVNEAAARRSAPRPRKTAGQSALGSLARGCAGEVLRRIPPRRPRERLGAFRRFYPQPLNRWFECHAYPSGDGMSLYFRDVTDRRHAEDALRLSEEKYRGVAEACPDAIVMSDLSGRVLFASRQAWGLLGLADSDELVGRSVFDYVTENDRQRLAGNIARLVHEGVRRNTEYTSLRKNGTTIPVEASSVVIRDASGQPKAVMAVIRDITERKQAQEALERERQSLWRMLQASDHERQ